jgi:hypothetical protein
VVIWVNGVGPYDNSHEKYDYYLLPYCNGSNTIKHQHESLGTCSLYCLILYDLITMN